jgi:hypothetical protein
VCPGFESLIRHQLFLSKINGKRLMRLDIPGDAIALGQHRPLAAMPGRGQE